MNPPESPIPSGEAEPLRVSTWLGSLNPSLMEDLLRFEQYGRSADVLEVLAACVRHARALTVRLQCLGRPVALSVFPRERIVHCAVDLQAVLRARRLDLPVLQVEAAALDPPARGAAPVGDASHWRPLAPLLWTFAMRGLRNALLPEVAGAAVYRVSPVFEIAQLPEGPIRELLRQMRRSVMNLHEIAAWPGLDADLAARLVNALYLQSGLIVSRSHPGALGDAS